jgi:hypothetical protein
MRFRNAFLLLAILAAPVCAQQTRLDERLPERTSFYVYWHGAASYEAVRSTNPLLRLWNDAEFAPARSALLEQFARGDEKTPLRAALTQEVVLALLDQPFVFGTISPRKPPETKPDAKSAAEKPPAVDNSFLIYDAGDKKPLIEKLLALEFAGAGSPPQVTRSAFGTSTIESVTSAKETYFRAFIGNVFVRAGQKEILEDLIGRLQTTPSAVNLSGTAGFQEARQVIGEHASLEFLFRIPDLTGTALPAAAGIDTGAVLKPLQMERLRAVCGGLTFGADATRLRMAVLGDTSPGGLLDVVGASTTGFATQVAAAPGTASFAAFRIDFPAIYKLAKSAVNAAIPAQQGNASDALEGMAAAALGMSISDALGLFTGEFASYSTELGIDPFSNYYAAGIRNPQKVLLLLRGILNQQILSEDTVGVNTFLSVTTSFKDAKTGAPRKRFYYVGVTPQMLVISPRKAALRETVQRLASAGGASAIGLAADAKFTAARGRIQQSLSGMSYSDLSRVRWEEVLEVSDQPAASPAKAGTPAAASAPDWRSLLKPAVLSRYLHLAVSGWWKGPDGLHFDGIIE